MKYLHGLMYHYVDWIDANQVDIQYDTFVDSNCTTISLWHEFYSILDHSKYHVSMRIYIPMELSIDVCHKLDQLPNKKKSRNEFKINNDKCSFTWVKYSRTYRLSSREHTVSQITSRLKNKIMSK